MALTKFGEIITGMSGSVGGTTHGHNRFGSYVRQKTKPVNPRSGLQTTIRDALALLSVRWSATLIQEQRDMWDDYGDKVVMKNKLGDDIYLTGFNHYMRSNVIAIQAGITVTDNGPTLWELPVHDPDFWAGGDQATQSMTYHFNNALDWASEEGAFLLKYMGSPQNPQRTFFAGPWRYHGKIAGATEPPSDGDTQGFAPFYVDTGQRIWVYGRIRRVDGRLSAPFQRSELAV